MILHSTRYYDVETQGLQWEQRTDQMNEGAEAHETRPTRTIAETDLIDQVTIITLWLVLGRSLSSQGVRRVEGDGICLL